MGISETVRHTFIFVFFHLHTCFTHSTSTCLELAIERVSRTVGKECGRNLRRAEFLHIGRSDTQPSIESVNHPDGTDIGGYPVKRIRAIVGSEGGTVYQTIEVEGLITAENTSGRKTHGSNVIRIYSIVCGVLTDKTDGPGKV